MKQRQSAYITIHSPQQGEVLSAPITESGRRTFVLMEKDEITLSFLSEKAVVLPVGAWVDDEIFGRFALASPYTPSLDASKGAYAYDLTFERPYRLWRNHLHRFGMETQWTLTDSLAVHVSQIVTSLSSFGVKVTTEIHTEDIAEAGYAKSLSFDGVSILRAIEMIAEAWGTEWWVDNSELHFGRLQNASSPLSLRYETNLASLTVERSSSDYANRVYALGGERNIPPSYRRRLEFCVTNVENGLAKDALRPLTTEMISGTEESVEATYTIGVTQTFTRGERFSIQRFGNSFTIEEATEYVFPAQMIEYFFNVSNDTELSFQRIGLSLRNLTTGVDFVIFDDAFFSTTMSAKASNYKRSVKWAGGVFSLEKGTYALTFISIGTAIATNLPLIPTFNSGGGGGSSSDMATFTTYDPNKEGEAKAPTFTLDLMEDPSGTSSGNTTLTPTNGSTDTSTTDGIILSGTLTLNFEMTIRSRYNTLRFILTRADGTNQEAMLNPNKTGEGTTSFGAIQTTPALAVGDTFTIVDVKEANIPYSYYTDDDETDNYGRIGSRRLLLPAPQSYVEVEGLHKDSIIETAVVFDDVYPKMGLIASSVSEDMSDYEETIYQDNTKKRTFYPRYTIRVDGFSFRSDYILEGTELEAVFLTPEEANSLGINVSQKQSCHLAGMAFGVKFNPDGALETDTEAQAFRLVRNEEYGAKLPNAQLRPTPGDPFILRGWNVRAIENLGLVEKAEETLERKAKEYLAAVSQGQFTYTATLISKTMFYGHFANHYDLPLAGDLVELPLSDFVSFVDKDRDSVMKEAQDKDILVLSHSAQNRIIGYEFKLDNPYDSPVLTIGETQAYSRLKRIEKEITKLSN